MHVLSDTNSAKNGVTTHLIMANYTLIKLKALLWRLRSYCIARQLIIRCMWPRTLPLIPFGTVRFHEHSSTHTVKAKVPLQKQNSFEKARKTFVRTLTEMCHCLPACKIKKRKKKNGNLFVITSDMVVQTWKHYV